MDEAQLKERILKSENIPAHVAIIMDGNGRWARRQGLSRIEGHKEGINSVREVVRASAELGVQHLTLYTFSTENWNRPASEVSALMRLLLKTIRSELQDLNENNVRLQVIGNLQDLPFPARTGMQSAIRLLSKNTGLTLYLALSYSSRREITDCIKSIVRKVQSGELTAAEIVEATVSQNLYTVGIPDPDLLIRTSGELRISNFLLWQLAYTEIYVSEVLWPDFRQEEYFQAILAYQKRERRFGKVSEQIQLEKAATGS